MNTSAIYIGSGLPVKENKPDLFDISRELHDHIGQKLTVVKLHLEKCMMQAADDKLKHQLNQILDTLIDSMQEVRSLSHELQEKCSVAGNDLREDLEKLAASFEYSSGLKVEFSKFDVFGELPGFARKNLYRVFQESFTNTVKHSHATRIFVSVRMHGSKLRITISDNGCVKKNINKATGHGMANIRYRIARLGGHVIFTCDPGYPFSTEIQVPLENLYD